MTFDFGSAIDELRAGERLQREGWNGKGQWLELQVPDETGQFDVRFSAYTRDRADD